MTVNQLVEQMINNEKVMIESIARREHITSIVQDVIIDDEYMYNMIERMSK